MEFSDLLPQEKRTFLRLLAAVQPLGRGKSATKHARALTESLLFQYLKAAYPLLSRHGLSNVEKFIDNEAFGKLCDWISKQQLNDAAFWISSIYAHLLPTDTRKDRALYFTPPELADRLIENLKSAGARLWQSRIVDPACGGAAFLVPVALQLRVELKKKGFSANEVLRHLQKHLVGFELDPVLCRLSKFFLRMALYTEIAEVGREPKFQIILGDTTKKYKAHVSHFDVVISNPPYRKIPSEQLEKVKHRFSHIVNGQPNLYGLFMGMSLELAKQDGRIALLTPTSFLSGRYFKLLRQYLCENAEIKQIDLVNDRNGIFLGASQETVVTVLVKRKVVSQSPKAFASNKTRDFKALGHCSLRSKGEAWIIPRTMEDVKLAKLFTKPQHTLTSLGVSVRVGGYVWHRDPRHTFMVISSKKLRVTHFPLVWSSHIRSTGRFVFASSGSTIDEHLFVNAGSAQSPLLLKVPSVALQRTSSIDQSHRLVCAAIRKSFVDKYGAYAGENHVSFLVPNDSSRVSVDLLAKILRTQVMDRVFRCVSGSVAISNSELHLLPMPDPDIVTSELENGEDIELAVKRGLGLAGATTKSGRHETILARKAA